MALANTLYNYKSYSFNKNNFRFHTSYGWLGILDWLHGTDDQFYKSKIHKLRHIRLMTTDSAREIYPDNVHKD